jgi:hypothetical protein
LQAINDKQKTQKKKTLENIQKNPAASLRKIRKCGNPKESGWHFSNFSIFLKFRPRGFSGSLITNLALVFQYKTFLPRYWQHVPR